MGGRESERCSVAACQVTAIGEYGVMGGRGEVELPYCGGHELEVLAMAAHAFKRLTAPLGT